LTDRSKVKGFQMLLPVDESDAFDYENAENVKYTLDDLKVMLI
jgi:hypothetical protein